MARKKPTESVDNVSGTALLSDFQSAFVSAATIEVAKFEAERSEDELLNHLNDVSGSTYLNPGNLDSDEQSAIARASLDAHVKKIQARQLDAYSQSQLQQQIAHDRQAYKGKRVRVTILQKNNGSVGSVWFNRQTGYRHGVVKYGKITGIIEEVLLERNTLVLKPTLASRVLTSSLRYYMVYPIHPAQLTPAVKLEII